MDSLYYEFERTEQMQASDDDALAALDRYLRSAAFENLPLIEQDALIARAEGRS